MGTLYVNKSDVVYVSTAGEHYSIGIGWTFVANQVSLEEWHDVVVGSTRTISIYDSIALTESVSRTIDFGMHATGVIPPRQLEALWQVDMNTSDFLKIPVRSFEGSGFDSLEGNIPVRTFEGAMEHEIYMTLSGTIPTREIEAEMGWVSTSGKIPLRTLEAEFYGSEFYMEGSIPVRSLEATMTSDGYFTLEGKLPVRLIDASMYEDAVWTLDKKRPIHLIVASMQEEGFMTLDRLIPIRKLEASFYAEEFFVEGTIPVWVIDASGFTDPSLGDYILRYTRP